MKSKNHFKSTAKSRYGITLAQAKADHIIEPNFRWSPIKKDYVKDGTWSPTHAGGRFDTPLKALAAHFAMVESLKEKHEEQAASVSLEDLPEYVRAALTDFSEPNVRKALRRLRNWVFTTQGEEYEEKHGRESIDAFFAYLKSHLPNFKVWG